MEEEFDLQRLQFSYSALFENLKRLISYKKDISFKDVDLGKDFSKTINALFDENLIDEGLNASVQHALKKYSNTYISNYSKLSEADREKAQKVVDIANQEVLDELNDFEKEIEKETDKIIASYNRY